MYRKRCLFLISAMVICSMLVGCGEKKSDEQSSVHLENSSVAYNELEDIESVMKNYT